MGCQSFTPWCKFGHCDGKDRRKNKVKVGKKCRYVHKDGKIKGKSSTQTKVINWKISLFPKNGLLMPHLPYLLIVLKQFWSLCSCFIFPEGQPLALSITYTSCTTNLYLVCMSAEVSFACLTDTKQRRYLYYYIPVITTDFSASAKHVFHDT